MPSRFHKFQLRRQKSEGIILFGRKPECVSGAAALVCAPLDAASDEEGLKVRNTKRLGHSLRETSRNTRKELQQIINASDHLPHPG